MKKLRNEKKRLPVGSDKIIQYFFLYILLIFGLVSVIMYVPYIDIDEDKVPATEETYSSGYDELSIDGSLITCSSENKKKIFNNASKIDVRYSHTTVQDDEPVENLAWEGEYEEDHYIYVSRFAMLITFINIPKDVKVVVTNNHNEDVVEFDSSSAVNGKYEFTTLDIEEIVLYTARVYTLNAECSDQLVRQFSFNLPRYNYNYLTNSCINNSAKECDLFTYDTEGRYDYAVSSEEIMENIEELEKQEEKKEKLKNRKYYSLPLAIGISVAIVAVSFLFFVLLIKIIDGRRKKRNEEL